MPSRLYHSRSDLDRGPIRPGQFFSPGRTPMAGIEEQAYNIFNGEGRLIQVEYGLEAVYNSSQIVTVCTSSEIVCVSKKLPTQPLCADQFTAVHQIADGMHMHITGLPADVDHVVEMSRTLAASLEFSLGCTLTPDVFTRTLADKMQKRIQRSGKRAPAFSACVCGFEKGTVPVAYYTDISAVEYPVKGSVAGEDHGKMQKYLEKNYEQGCSREKAVDTAVATLLESIGRDAEYSEIEAIVVTEGGLDKLSDQEIAKVLQEIAERQ